MMKRSPRVSTAGASSRRRTSARPPAAISDDVPAIETRPSTSAVPLCTRTRAPCLRGRADAQQIDLGVDAPRHAQRAGRHQRLAARDVADLDAAKIDRRALAGHGLRDGRPCTCTPRTLTRRPPG